MSLPGLLLAGELAATLSARGQQLYEGQLPLPGTPRGHAQPLPTAASRCINCHEPSAQINRADTALGPRLDNVTLTQPQVRRSGPPSSYDQAAFCHLLRTSVDPNTILIKKAMPQYTVSAQDCDALWQYLSQRVGPT